MVGSSNYMNAAPTCSVATEPFTPIHRHAPRRDSLGSRRRDVKGGASTTFAPPPPLRNSHPRRCGAVVPPAATAFVAALTLAVSSTYLASFFATPSWLDAFPFSTTPLLLLPPREKVVVNRPALRIHSLHSCWAHALLDSLPPVFAAAENLRGAEWTLVLGRDIFEGLPANVAMLTGNGTADGDPVRYKGAWGEMLEALNATEILFEHLVEPVFNRSMIDVDYYERMSVWDSNETYPGRSPRNRTDPGVPFEVRVRPYRTMIRRVLERARLPFKDDDNHHGGGTARNKTLRRRDRVLLIDREGGDRQFLPYVLTDLVAALEEGSNNATDPNNATATVIFDGVQRFVDMTVREQLAHVRSADVMVLRHGSAEAWGAFLRPGSVLFEVNAWGETREGDMRPRMYDQVCRISGCRHVNVEEHEAVQELCTLLSMNGTACNEASMKDEWGGYPFDEERMYMSDEAMIDMTDETTVNSER